MIRPAEPRDFSAIDAFDDFGGNRRREIAEQRCLVCEQDGAVVGYVSWLPEGFISNHFVSFLMVAETGRRRGVATRLLAAVETRLRPCKLFISTDADNEVMLALLRARGWSYSGTIEAVNRNGGGESFFRKVLA
jgi:ribosomal protein S18 acetylase RimI-like enzyme